MKRAAILLAILFSGIVLAQHYLPPAKYGAAFTLHFSIFDSNSPWQFYETAPAAADVHIRKDGGSAAHATNGVTDLDHTMTLLLTATEMQAAVVTVDVNDASSPALFGSDTWVIYTYGYLGLWKWIDVNDGVNVDEIRLSAPMALADVQGILTTEPATTVAVVTSASEFTLTAGSTTNAYYYNDEIVVSDVSDSGRKAPRFIRSYDGATKKVLLDEALPFTPAPGDICYIILNRAVGRGRVSP